MKTATEWVAKYHPLQRDRAKNVIREVQKDVLEYAIFCIEQGGGLKELKQQLATLYMK